METPKCYIEDGFNMDPFSLPGEVYSEALRSFVIVCTDVAIVDRSEQRLYLAKRRARPASGKWWFIGGRSLAGETERTSMMRCFRRETGIAMLPERFEYTTMNRYQWKDREQEPTNAGNDSLCYTFALELSSEERQQVAKALDRSEYYDEVGLRGFTREELVSEGALPQIIDFYDLVFP